MQVLLKEQRPNTIEHPLIHESIPCTTSPVPDCYQQITPSSVLLTMCPAELSITFLQECQCIVGSANRYSTQGEKDSVPEVEVKLRVVISVQKCATRSLIDCGSILFPYSLL